MVGQAKWGVGGWGGGGRCNITQWRRQHQQRESIVVLKRSAADPGRVRPAGGRGGGGAASASAAATAKCAGRSGSGKGGAEALSRSTEATTRYFFLIYRRQSAKFWLGNKHEQI